MHNAHFTSLLNQTSSSQKLLISKNVYMTQIEVLLVLLLLLLLLLLFVLCVCICLVFIIVTLCVFVILCVYCCFILDAGLLARSQHPEGPATGHLDTGFSWFPCVYKRILRSFPSFQVATTCFSSSPPDLNFLVTYLIFVYV